MRFDSTKFVKLIIGIVSYAVVYFAVKYALPLFVPFVAAYILAWCIRPIDGFLKKRFGVKDGTSAFLSLAFVVSVLAVALCGAGINAAGQMGNIVRLWNNCSGDVANQMKHTCSYIEHSMGLGDGTIYHGLVRYAGGFDTADITTKLMGSSVNAAVASVEYIVAVFVVVIAAFYFLKDRDAMAKKRAASPFGREINRIMGSIYATGIAYIKTQAVIMAITAVVCFIGFKIADIKYAAVYAAAVGFLDALPLLGTGVLLLPAALIFAIRRNFRAAVIIVIVFIICYCVREVLEPRIMGKNAGLSPIMTMLTMYVGYKIFGLMGVITGPLSYIAANELTNILINGVGDESDEKVEDNKT